MMFGEASAVMLLVGEQEEAANAISESFPKGEVQLYCTDSGRQAVILAMEAHPSVIITETKLRDMPVTDLVRSFREWSLSSIIAISGDNSQQTKTELLNSGADDYLVKPFGLQEFRARVRVAFRHRNTRRKDYGPIYKMGGTTVNLATRTVHKNGELIPLTPLEFQILAELTKSAEHIVTREYLTRKIWSEMTITELQTLRVYIGTLRNKLGRYPDGDVVIETITGVGYRLIHTWTLDDDLVFSYR